MWNNSYSPSQKVSPDNFNLEPKESHINFSFATELKDSVLLRISKVRTYSKSRAYVLHLSKCHFVPCQLYEVETVGC